MREGPWSRNANREVLHVRVTHHPTQEWVAQQIVECCGWDREPPRFLIHDRDSRYGKIFDRRLSNLGITQIRTPFRSPRANAIAERWVRSARTERLDLMFILSERHLGQVLLSMSAISTAGGHTGRLANARAERHRATSKPESVATSLRHRCSVGCITFAISLHDHPDTDLRPTTTPPA